MLAIHEFWTELFPIFQQDYEFVYIFFDIATILTLIKMFLELPRYILTGGCRL